MFLLYYFFSFGFNLFYHILWTRNVHNGVIYGRDFYPGTTTEAEKAYKEPWKLANEAMVTHKTG